MANTPKAIIIGSILIALTIIFASRWNMAASGDNTYRLDRWTGKIVSCNSPKDKQSVASQLGVGLEYDCGEIDLLKVPSK